MSAQGAPIPPRVGVRVLRFQLISIGLLVASVLVLTVTQPRAAAGYAQAGRESDVYAMPQEEQLLVFSLGYRAALADLLFGKTMVAAGVHFVEKRIFRHLDAYLRGIIALEPRYRDVYYFADTLLNLSSVEMPIENLRIARDIIEEGLGYFPGDAELWMNAGLFVAYMAPNRLERAETTEDVSEWRAAGARMIGRACEVWPPDRPLPATCVSSSKHLAPAGQNQAGIASLERLLALTDDSEMRASIMGKLENLMGQRAARERGETLALLSQQHADDMPSASRTRYQLLSPATNVARCSGPREVLLDRECASSFARWSEAREMD